MDARLIAILSRTDHVYVLCRPELDAIALPIFMPETDRNPST